MTIETNLPARLMNIEDMAKILGLDPYTVREMCRKGELPAFKVGKAWRVSVVQFEDWVKERTHGG